MPHPTWNLPHSGNSLPLPGTWLMLSSCRSHKLISNHLFYSAVPGNNQSISHCTAFLFCCEIVTSVFVKHISHNSNPFLQTHIHTHTYFCLCENTHWCKAFPSHLPQSKPKPGPELSLVWTLKWPLWGLEKCPHFPKIPTVQWSKTQVQTHYITVKISFVLV